MLNDIERIIVDIYIKSNRSLAGLNLYNDNYTEKQKSVLTDWGAILTTNKNDSPPKRDSFETEYRIKYAQKHMCSLSKLTDRILKNEGKILEGLNISTALVLEIKTCVLLLCLKKLGANLMTYCEGHSTDERVIPFLQENGVQVFADSTATMEQDEIIAKKAHESFDSDIIIDDSGFFTEVLYKNFPEKVSRLKVILEETTSGVRRFTKWQKENTLKTPVIAVNDLIIKTGFDNLSGTGESVVASMLHVIGETIQDKTIYVIGAGPVGMGVAKRVRALSKKTLVYDNKKLPLLKMVYDGYEVDTNRSKLGDADILISATGIPHTVDSDDFKTMKDGCIIVTAGGKYQEIALNKIKDDGANFIKTDNPEIKKIEYLGKTFTLLSEGNGINYTACEGNSIEIMDMSLSAQLLSLIYYLNHKDELENKVIRLSDDISEEIATQMLS